MENLSEQEVTGLRWMKRVNAAPDPIGLYYPTVRRFGPLPELARVVELGLAKYEPPRSRTPIDRSAGYWITDAGRRALSPSQ